VGVGPGDEVITPTRGYIGSYCGALHQGARPVLCDIDRQTLLIDPADAERRITPRTRAINPICLNGQVCDLDALMDIGRRNGLAVVNDACHTIGAEWGGRKLGSVADITCFSLQGTDPFGKPVSGGEGGIATTNNRELYERMLTYCHLHRTGIAAELTNPAYRALGTEGVGLKFRAHPLALALAKVSLDTLEERNAGRAAWRRTLYGALADLPGLEPPRSYPKALDAGFYGGLKMIYHPEELGGLPRERFVAAVRAEGVRLVDLPGRPEHLRALFTRGFDLWAHDRGPLGGAWCGLPPFEGYRRGDFPVAEWFLKRDLTLPCYIAPREGTLEQTVEAFRKVAEGYRQLL
jgi:dTDP-4-amino-4,6-dideoxygalactose transaminase